MTENMARNYQNLDDDKRSGPDHGLARGRGSARLWTVITQVSPGAKLRLDVMAASQREAERISKAICDELEIVFEKAKVERNAG